jgi:molecular chaperone GrpE
MSSEKRQALEEKRVVRYHPSPGGKFKRDDIIFAPCLTMVDSTFIIQQGNIQGGDPMTEHDAMKHGAARSGSHLKKDVKKDTTVIHIPITKGSDESAVRKDAEAEVKANPGKPEPEKEPEAKAEAKPEAVNHDREETVDRDEQIKTLKEEKLRVYAEFENFRRRKEEEVANARKYASEEIIKQLLQIYDNFERAVDTSKSSRNFDSLLEGVQLIIRQMKELMEKEGVTEIQAEGAPFDPNLHQAVMKVDNDELPDETIVEVLQKGYKLKDKVIRPSMVKVSRK